MIKLIVRADPNWFPDPAIGSWSWSPLQKVTDKLAHGLQAMVEQAVVLPPLPVPLVAPATLLKNGESWFGHNIVVTVRADQHRGLACAQSRFLAEMRQQVNRLLYQERDLIPNHPPKVLLQLVAGSLFELTPPVMWEPGEELVA